MNLKILGANQAEITNNGRTVLYSYETPVAYLDKKTSQYFKTSKKWSKTTSKHINAWLGDIKAFEVPQEEINKAVA